MDNEIKYYHILNLVSGEYLILDRRRTINGKGIFAIPNPTATVAINSFEDLINFWNDPTLKWSNSYIQKPCLLEEFEFFEVTEEEIDEYKTRT